MKLDSIQCQRGEIYIADLDPIEGCEQGGIRPVVVVQCNVLNQTSPTAIIAPLTSQLKKPYFPAHATFQKISGLPYPSMVLAEQPRAIAKSRFQRCVGGLTEEQMRRVSLALKYSMELEDT